MQKFHEWVDVSVSPIKTGCNSPALNGCFQKYWYPKMDGLFHGKPYFLMDDLGGKTTPIFGSTPKC